MCEFESFNHIRKQIQENTSGKVKRYKRLEDQFCLGGKDDLKKIVSNTYISFFLDDDLDREMVFQRLSHYGKIFMDVNGLKTTNEMTNHEKGDIHLLRIVRCLIYDEKIVRFIKKFNIHFPKKIAKDEYVFVPFQELSESERRDVFYQVFREGGDEFSMLIYSPDQPLTDCISSDGWLDCSPGDCSKKRPIIRVFLSLVVNQISNIRIDDLVPLSCMRSKMSGHELVMLEKAINAGFVHTASVAGSEVTFDFIVSDYIKSNDVPYMDFTREEWGNTFMGSTQNYTDKIANRHKAMFKKMCRESTDPNDNLEGLLITRGGEAQMLYGLLRKLKERMRGVIENYIFQQAMHISDHDRILDSSQNFSPSKKLKSINKKQKETLAYLEQTTDKTMNEIAA